MTEERTPNAGEVARGTDARSNETRRKEPVFVINFDPKSRVSLGELFGTKPLSASQMIDRLWEYIKNNGLYAKR